MNVQEAKTHLSRLLEDALRGEEIIIAKAGRPYVRLVPCEQDDSPRPFGGWEGRVEIAEDFDRTPDEVIELFEGPAASPRSERPRSERKRTKTPGRRPRKARG